MVGPVDSKRARGSRAASAVALGLLSGACASAAWSAWLWMRHREPLATLWDGQRWTWIAALALAVTACLAAVALEFRAWSRGSRPGNLASVLRRVFTCAVLGWLGVHAFLQPMRVLYLEFAAGLVLGAFAATIVGEHALGARRLWRTRRALDFALFNVCLLALGGELGLRWLATARRSPLFAQADVGTEQIIRLHRAYRSKLRLGFPFNSEGFYDGERPARSPERKLVVALGDSFAVGIVPHHYHYTTIVERELGDVDVYNVGVAGIGPSEYIELVDSVAKPMRADAIVVTIFIGNDIDAPLRLGATPMTRLRRWFSRDNLLLYLVPSRLTAIAGEGEVDAGNVGEGQDEPWETPEEMAAAMPWLEDPLQEEAQLELDSFLRIERGRALEVCGKGAEAYRTIEAALAILKERCEATPLVLVLIPDEFQVEEAVWQQVLDGVPEAAEWDRFLPQQELAAIAERLDLSMVDLLPALRAVEPMEDGRRHVFHLQDTHFNARGNRVAAREIADRLRVVLGR